MSRRIDRFGRPAIFRSIERGNSNLTFSTGSIEEYATNIKSKNSFRYEPYDSPLKSTQQLSINFSKFENHTFFNSAVGKVSVAFNKIINKYPFDGTLSEIEEFEDKLTGYEKYILDIFPKHTGYLTTSGSSYINVKNRAGINFPEYSSNKTASKILDPRNQSFSFEAFISVPSETNASDMGLFHISGSNIKIESYVQRHQAGFATASFRLTSGSFTEKIKTIGFEKSKFQHISFVVDKENNDIKAYLNGKESTDDGPKTLLTRDIIFNSDFSILKSGTDENGLNYANFSGSIKDFRLYHQGRNESLIKKDFKQTVYKNDNLKLNFRFNEPSGSYSIENYLIDTSGNSLHSKIENFDRSSRDISLLASTEKLSNPVENENLSRNHILFPDYAEITILNSELITSGSEYDKINPNLITKLIPPHYFEDAIFEDGKYSELSTLNSNIKGSSIPGSAETLETGLLTILLLSWANIFDEIKMFIDSFGNIIFSDYHDSDIVPDQLIGFAAKQLGVDLPPMFTNDNSEKYFNSKNVYSQTNINKVSLKKIQSLIWKRLLADSIYYKRTKGTIESLKTTFRSAGIDPDKMFAFIEKGSNTVYLSDNNNEEKFVQIPLINFSGSLALPSYTDTDEDTSDDLALFEGTITSKGFSPNKPNFVSTVLSGSKLNKSFPVPQGPLVGISNVLTGSANKEDGMFTSGSWSYEGYYKFDKKSSTPVTQSLARINRHEQRTTDYTTGNIAGILNIIAIKNTNVFLTGSNDSVIAYFSEDLANDTARKIKIDNINIFNGDLWYVSFSKERSDDPANKDLNIGNKYTLTCGRYGSEENFVTSSYFSGSNFPIGYKISSSLASFTGSQVMIGSQSLNFQNRYGLYSIPASNAEFNNINYTDFSGKIGSIRFWSKSLTSKERLSHQKNINNFGVENPMKNIIFKKESETSEKIRLNVTGLQEITSSADGTVIGVNRTQFENSFSQDRKSKLSGFELNKNIMSYDRFKFLSFPNKFDEINSTNKIRINSLDKAPDLNLGYQGFSPAYEIKDYNIINDDARFAIEMSIARIINDDINNEIATVEFFENILGRYNNVFSSNYSNLESFSREYFRNHQSEIKLNKLLSVYTWLESSFEDIIEKSLPKKTKFLGMNYVIEPHNLERSRIQLNYAGSYMGSTPNNESSQNIGSLGIYLANISNRH